VEVEKNKISLFQKLLPVAAVVLATLALFGQGFPEWVRYSALAIGVLLAVAWLFSETGWVGRAIKSWLFRSKLSRDQAVRLSVLLDDISNHMSYSYTLSPFYVWRNAANAHPRKIKMNDSYHGAVHDWLLDLKEALTDPRRNSVLLIGSLSKAIHQATRLAKQAESELHELLQRTDLTENDKREIRKNWDSARNHFNQWIDKWQILFREVSKTANVSCVQYYRPLEMIG
jgi:hypothetical protein